jgi:hypothetical protein
VFVSGYLDGEFDEDKILELFYVEVETMQFVVTARGGEGVGSPRTPGKSKFGIPIRFGFIGILIFHFTNCFSVGRRDREAPPIRPGIVAAFCCSCSHCTDIF